jgi:hypothetical protein
LLKKHVADLQVHPHSCPGCTSSSRHTR